MTNGQTAAWGPDPGIFFLKHVRGRWPVHYSVSIPWQEELSRSIGPRFLVTPASYGSCHLDRGVSTRQITVDHPHDYINGIVVTNDRQLQVGMGSASTAFPDEAVTRLVRDNQHSCAGGTFVWLKEGDQYRFDADPSQGWGERGYLFDIIMSDRRLVVWGSDPEIFFLKHSWANAGAWPVHIKVSVGWQRDLSESIGSDFRVTPASYGFVRARSEREEQSPPPFGPHPFLRSCQDRGNERALAPLPDPLTPLQTWVFRQGRITTVRPIYPNQPAQPCKGTMGLR